MPFRKGLNKYLKKNTAYKYSPVNRFAKSGYYILYSYTPASTRRNNSFKLIITFRTIKNI